MNWPNFPWARSQMQFWPSFVERYPNGRFVLTLGHKGVQYRDGNATASHGIYRVQAVDTTAAGDTFTGYFLTYVAEGKPVADASSCGFRRFRSGCDTSGCRRVHTGAG
ncbi:MAG: PfkB family carbohydrate kinase [Clostridia bacterium]